MTTLQLIDEVLLLDVSHIHVWKPFFSEILNNVDNYKTIHEGPYKKTVEHTDVNDPNMRTV